MPQLGHRQFKGCKYCRHPRTCPNPPESLRDTKPLLQFRNDRHAECCPCIGSIRTARETSQTAQRRTQKKLPDYNSVFELHVSEVVNYQEKLEERSHNPKYKSTSSKRANATRRVLGRCDPTEGTMLLHFRIQVAGRVY